MKLFKYGVYALCASAMLSISSCFNLDEEPYSEIIEEDYVPTEADEIALLATTYSQLRFVMDWYGLFDLQEESGDVIVTPTRPNGWDDGGTYKQMHKHTWDNQQGQPQSIWDYCYKGIANANKILKRADEGFFTEESKPKVVAEVKGVRALWYSILCDTHGNIPIQTSFSEEVPVQSTRKQVFDFIINELKEVMPNLPTEVNKSTYGRLTQWGAKCLLPSLPPFGYYFRLWKLLLVKYFCTFRHFGIGYFLIPTGLGPVCTVVYCKLLKIILYIFCRHP